MLAERQQVIGACAQYSSASLGNRRPPDTMLWRWALGTKARAPFTPGCCWGCAAKPDTRAGSVHREKVVHRGLCDTPAIAPMVIGGGWSTTANRAQICSAQAEPRIYHKCPWGWPAPRHCARPSRCSRVSTRQLMMAAA